MRGTAIKVGELYLSEESDFINGRMILTKDITEVAIYDCRGCALKAVEYLTENGIQGAALSEGGRH